LPWHALPQPSEVATTDLNLPVVPQTRADAAAINENLKHIKMPPGFKMKLHAAAPMRA